MLLFLYFFHSIESATRVACDSCKSITWERELWLPCFT